MVIRKTKDKFHILKIIIILSISCLLSFVMSTLMSADFGETIKEIFYAFSSEDERSYKIDDFSVSDYSVQDSLLTTLSEDPMLVIKDSINTKISNITLYFLDPIEKDMDVQIYYTNERKVFNENQVVVSQIKSGENKIKINIQQYVESLRIDIGTVSNLQFELKEIIVNEDIKISEAINQFLQCFKNSIFSGIWLERFKLSFILFLFLGMHFIVKVNDLYNFLFKNRWLVSLIILMFIVVNKYNGESMSLYDTVVHIQEGQGSEYIEPIFGTPRAIRSDEWIVRNPNKLSSSFGDAPYSKYNSVMRGTETLNSVQGIYKGYSTLGKNPFLLAYFITDIEYAFSFNWYAPIILLFLVSIEMFMIISNRKELLSVTGAFLIVFSSFYLWWEFPIQILASQSAIVCAYYFLNVNIRWKKALFGIGTAISTSMFVTNLYPAWQVPLGYMAFALLVWLLHDNIEKIKKLDKNDWGIVVLSFVFLISLVGTYFYDTSDYVLSISNTVYPGKRVDNGGFSLNKIFYYFQSILYPYKHIENPSEAAVFMSFFPIPFIAAIFLWVKEKKKDWLTGGLIIVNILLLIYTTIGLPKIVAKVTLLSNSTSIRVIDIIGFIQVYFIIIIFSRYELKNRMRPILGVIIGFTTAIVGMFVCLKDFPNYVTNFYLFVGVIAITVICYYMLTDITEKILRRILISLIGISLITGVTVRPIMKGLDAIYSKPIAVKLMEIVENDKNAKWLAYGGGNALQGFAVACGVPTINAVNMYPNLELWYKLDETRKYEDIYNRYAHINLNFTHDATSMEIIQGDYFTLNLSYDDIYKTDAKYILSLIKLEEEPNENLNFNLIYNNYECYIYEIIYE